ncbi:unnamed protein product [Arctogadus glacialis]
MEPQRFRPAATHAAVPLPAVHWRVEVRECRVCLSDLSEMREDTQLREGGSSHHGAMHDDRRGTLIQMSRSSRRPMTRADDEHLNPEPYASPADAAER